MTNIRAIRMFYFKHSLGLRITDGCNSRVNVTATLCARAGTIARRMAASAVIERTVERRWFIACWVSSDKWKSPRPCGQQPRYYTMLRQSPPQAGFKALKECGTRNAVARFHDHHPPRPDVVPRLETAGAPKILQALRRLSCGTNTYTGIICCVLQPILSSYPDRSARCG